MKKKDEQELANVYLKMENQGVRSTGGNRWGKGKEKGGNAAFEGKS